MEQKSAELKAHRRTTPKPIMFSELPEEDRFRMLGTKSKYFIDTIKLIAYRAETSIVNQPDRQCDIRMRHEANGFYNII